MKDSAEYIGSTKLHYGLHRFFADIRIYVCMYVYVRTYIHTYKQDFRIELNLLHNYLLIANMLYNLDALTTITELHIC